MAYQSDSGLHPCPHFYLVEDDYYLFETLHVQVLRSLLGGFSTSPAFVVSIVSHAFPALRIVGQES